MKLWLLHVKEKQKGFPVHIEDHVFHQKEFYPRRQSSIHILVVTLGKIAQTLGSVVLFLYPLTWWF